MKQQTARSISLGRALCIAGLLMAAAGAMAQASVIKYVITNNGGSVAEDVEGTLPDALASITGGFTYDTSTMAITQFSVTFNTAITFGGTYTDDSNPSVDPDHTIRFKGVSAGGFDCAFTLDLNDFGDVGQFFITRGYVEIPFQHDRILNPHDPQNPPYLTGTLQLGGPAVVPEPSTWAMMLGALAGAGAATRIRRRKEYTK